MFELEIQSLEAKRSAYLQTATNLVSRAQSEGRDLSKSELRDYEGLLEKVESMDGTMRRARDVGGLLSSLDQPVYPSAGHSSGFPRFQDPNAGISVARLIRALAACKGVPYAAAEFADRNFADLRVSRALAAGSGSAGGFLVPADISREVIELLRPASVVRRLGALSVPMPLGNLDLPRVVTGSTATYIGEGQHVANTEPTFGQLKLTARKLAALVPVSNDLLRFSSPGADAIIKNDLVAALAQAEDLAFIRGTGTGAGPKGLRYWAPTANVLTVNATVNAANIGIDLGRAMLALLNANCRMIAPGWLMSPRTMVYLQNLRDANSNLIYPEMNQGRLRGYPFGSTTQIPVNLAVTGTNESEIYLVDFADAIIGEADSLIIDVSDTAAYHDGSSVISAFSKDQTVVRVISIHDFGMRHDASVAVLSDVDWA